MFERERTELEALESGSKPEIDAKRADICSRIRNTARSWPGQFLSHVDNLNFCMPEDASHAMDLVEALSSEPGEWRRELIHIFETAVAASVGCPESQSPANVLSSFAFLEGAAEPGHAEMLPRYVELTKAASPRLRRAAIDLFGGFQISSTAGLRALLVASLRDPDWQVRRDAEVLLADEQLLPDKYRTPVADRIRRFLHKWVVA